VLFFSAIFLIFNVRERRHFWSSKPSTTLLTAMMTSIAVGMVIVTVGIPNLEPLPFVQTLVVLSLSALFSLGINDSVKSLLVEKGKVSW